MSAADNGGPAFPVLPPVGPDGTSAVGYPYVTPGISIRDYFAAKAMQGMYASDTPDWCISDDDCHKRAASAYRMADAMLKERAK